MSGRGLAPSVSARDRRKSEIAAAARRAAIRHGEVQAERLARQIERIESGPSLDDGSLENIPLMRRML